MLHFLLQLQLMASTIAVGIIPMLLLCAVPIPQRQTILFKMFRRIRIEIELRQRNLSVGNIRRGLTEISDSAYEKCLCELIRKLGGAGAGDKVKLKVMRNLIQRGFERERIGRVIKLNQETDF